MEYFVLSNADTVTTVSQPLVDDLVARLRIPKNKVSLITNGFDPDEWNIPDEHVIKARANFKDASSKLLMAHMGRLSAARADVAAYPLFEALHNLKRTAPLLPRQLEILFVGIVDGPEAQMAKKLNIEDIVRFHSTVPKSEAVAIMKAADVLLLVTSPSLTSIVTAKLFDYIGSGKPVLALAEGNAAAQIITQTGIGLTVSPINISEIAKALQRVLVLWKTCGFPFAPRQSRIHAYTREEQTTKMAEVLVSISKTVRV